MFMYNIYIHVDCDRDTLMITDDISEYTHDY